MSRVWYPMILEVGEKDVVKGGNKKEKLDWLECQKLESFYFGELGKSRRSAVLKKKYNHV